MPYQSAYDLLQNDQMKRAQLGAMGQEGRLRDLQMQTALEDRNDAAAFKSQLPGLMQGGNPMEKLSALMATGNPKAIALASQLAPVFAAMQKDTKTTWQDAGDKLAQIDAYGQPTGRTMPKGASPQQPDKLPWYVQKGQDGRPAGIDPLYRDFERMKAANMRPPAQPMAPVAYVDDKGRTVWGTITDARGKQAANYNPAVQGAIAGAREAGKSGVEMQTEAKKAIKKSDQLLGIAQQAKELLDKGPTGSGIGAAVDVAGRIIGKTSESSKTAADLETLSGWMVANVPRMEGPQSNFDVQNYQTMAAKVGDRTVPVSERKSALNTLIALQNKYKRLNQDAVNPPDQPAAPSVDSLLDKYK